MGIPPNQLKSGAPDSSIQNQQQIQSQMPSDQINSNQFVNQAGMNPTDPQMMQDIQG